MVSATVMNDVVKQLRAIAIVPPQDSGGFDVWLEQKDVLAFLNDNISEREFVLYASLPFTFIYGIAVPTASLEPLDVDDLMAWGTNPWSSWCVATSFSDPPEVDILPPLNNVGSRVLANGEQLLFGRRFDGRQEQKSYFELSQKLAHLLDLHYVPERLAYCKFDRRGDVEDVVRVIDLPKEGGRDGGTLVTVLREALDEYLALTEAAVVRFFDVTRCKQTGFAGWRNERTELESRDGASHYRKAVEPGYASYTRGFQVVRPNFDKLDVLERSRGECDDEKCYAEFISQDWKNNVVAEISCSPTSLANYFTKSDLPFEITPAFFRPDVLLKYKKDPEKYLLDERSITSHNAWHLQTYDINEAGQVHTYLIYLSRLPYDEQLYWKSFNEAPKAPISKRAFATDMKGEVFVEYDPLGSLKGVLRQLHSHAVSWWKLRSDRLIQLVHYPVTKSAEEWADELMALDKLVVEGFEERWLRKKAGGLGKSPKEQDRSLRLIEHCLSGLGFEEDHALEIVAPFREVHNLRSQLKGHAAGSEASKIRAQAISVHGSYRKQFETLCGRCDESMRKISKAFDVPLQN